MQKTLLMNQKQDFLASQDEWPGSLCHSPSLNVHVCVWTKTLTLAITFKPLKIKLSYFLCIPYDKTFHIVP